MFSLSILCVSVRVYLPYRRSVPTWLKLSCDDVQEQIYKLAKKGLTPSQIGKHFEPFAS